MSDNLQRNSGVENGVTTAIGLGTAVGLGIAGYYGFDFLRDTVVDGPTRQQVGAVLIGAAGYTAGISAIASRLGKDNIFEKFPLANHDDNTKTYVLSGITAVVGATMWFSGAFSGSEVADELGDIPPAVAEDISGVDEDVDVAVDGGGEDGDIEAAPAPALPAENQADRISFQIPAIGDTVTVINGVGEQIQHVKQSNCELNIDQSDGLGIPTGDVLGVKQIQYTLNDYQFPAGPIDGIWSPNGLTDTANDAFEFANILPPTQISELECSYMKDLVDNNPATPTAEQLKITDEEFQVLVAQKQEILSR